MSLFVYITESCKADAHRHGLSDEIHRFKDRVEKAQATSQFDPFPPPYLVKKKLGGRQGRLIADLRTIGDHAVVVFLAVMIRGDRAYEDQFGPDPASYGNQHFKHLVAHSAISSCIEQRTRTEPPPAKPDPSDEEFAFLYETFAHRESSGEEDMVYETPEWKEAVQDERIANQLVRFAEPCLGALGLQPGMHRVEIPDKKGWGIWVFRTEGRLLLITPITDSTADSAEQIADRYRENLGVIDDLPQIIRASRRAYPAYMLVEEDTWIEIEKEPVANMALSPEESEVLMSARNPEGAFPLFINGRAGSGKSTILQYLFADLLYYYLSKPESQVIAPPVYLTANGELLRVARSFVERILRSEASFRQNGTPNLVSENTNLLGEAFQEFRPFLLSLIPADIKRERFAPADYVDYIRFRTLWSEWFSQDPEATREFGPDVCWHIIRSYIKGMLSEALMDPDEYEQLPENQLTVSKTTFAQVFDRVWDKRYRPLQEARTLWDDQDLVRYILDQDLAKPVYPAILCDEAQDFTRIEMELLLRINLFSDRAVPAHDLSRVPFAFAGDQFQTLNPTGFRWDAIKVAFIEKFIHALDPAGRSGRTELNYHELRYNYRSTPPIVRFSNGVQAMRAAVLRMPELKPQTPWAYFKGVFPVVWFECDDAAFWKKFKIAESFVLVVPCNEGEEAAYVKADPILREHIPFEDGIPLNVLSAARAKGREYAGVLVYGFGSACPEMLRTILESLPDATDQERHQLLPLEYFFSRLYVAVSRPKNRLIIVDSHDAITGLWDFLNREDKTAEIVSVADRGRSLWTVDPEDPKQPAVVGMAMGNADDLTKDSAGDPLENAKAFEEDGRARKDAFLLRQAAQAYRAAGDTQKALECRGRALEIESAFFDAAKAFCDSGLAIPNGSRCYLKAGKTGWKELYELGKHDARVARETEFKLARVCLGEDGTKSNCVEILEEIAKRMEKTSFAVEVTSHKGWQLGIETVIDLAISRFGESNPPTQKLERIIEQIESGGVRISSLKMAIVHDLAGNPEKAVQRWQEAGETTSANYLRAKAAISPYPDKLDALSRIGDTSSVIAEFEQNRSIPLNKDQWRLVADSFLELNRFAEAFDAAWEAQDPALFRHLNLKAIDSKQEEFAIRGLRACMTTMVASGEWGTLVKFVSSLELTPDKEWNNPTIREMVDSQSEALQCSLVAGLARSEQFANLPSHQQRHFSDFLRRFLRVKEARWRSSVSVEEAGSAIERGGRFTDTLSFYEAIQKEPNFSENEKVFARERWLVNKNRQLDYERQQDPHHRRVSELQREIRATEKQMGKLRSTNLPEFPSLDPIAKPSILKPETESSAGHEHVSRIAEGPKPKGSTTNSTPAPSSTIATKGNKSEKHTAPNTDNTGATATLPDRVSAQIGDLRIELSRSLGRCNFSHAVTMVTAHLNLIDNSVGGEIRWSQKATAQWTCDEWGIVVRVDKTQLEIEETRLSTMLSFGLIH